jgi:hypothetical protein
VTRAVFGLSGAVWLAALLAGCVSQAQVDQMRAEDRAWGDRTTAFFYTVHDPLIAYFAPGETEGAMFVWDGGETQITQGRWYISDQKLCVTHNVYRKEMIVIPALRTAQDYCTPLHERPYKNDYRGDVYGLSGKTVAPFVLSKATTDRAQEPLKGRQRISEIRP